MVPPFLPRYERGIYNDLLSQNTFKAVQVRPKHPLVFIFSEILLSCPKVYLQSQRKVVPKISYKIGNLVNCFYPFTHKTILLQSHVLYEAILDHSHRNYSFCN